MPVILEGALQEYLLVPVWIWLTLCESKCSPEISVKATMPGKLISQGFHHLR